MSNESGWNYLCFQWQRHCFDYGVVSSEVAPDRLWTPSSVQGRKRVGVRGSMNGREVDEQENPSVSIGNVPCIPTLHCSVPQDRRIIDHIEIQRAKRRGWKVNGPVLWHASAAAMSINTYQACLTHRGCTMRRAFLYRCLVAIGVRVTSGAACLRSSRETISG